MAPDKERCWPYLMAEGYTVTSAETWGYNCIAFAADVETEWWWPDAMARRSGRKGLSEKNG